MGGCFSSDGNMDTAQTRQGQRAAAKATEKAQTSKSTQREKIDRAEKSGVLSLAGARLKEIPSRVFELQKVSSLGH